MGKVPIVPIVPIEEATETEQQLLQSVLEEAATIPGGLLSSLIQEYAPAEQTFMVTLPKGEELPFRKISDGCFAKQLQEDAAGWAQRMLKSFRQRKLKAVKGAVPFPEGLVEFFVEDASVLAQVYCLAKLAVDAELSGNYAGFLQLYRQAYPIYNAIAYQIDRASANMIAAGDERIYEDEKKD